MKFFLYEREDDAYLLKLTKCLHSSSLMHSPQRIASHTWSGDSNQLKLERFVEALQDPTSNLTYSALTGSWKQSVVDAECLFNPDLERFMAGKGYQFEANYVKTIRNWRRANDERGHNEKEWSKLMPWHKEQYDFSLLEVNR